MKGQRYDDETKERALALLASGSRIAEVSNELDIPAQTLKNWRSHASINDPRFEELRKEQRGNFISGAWECIQMNMELIKRQAQRAVEHEDELDKIIEIVEGSEDLTLETKAQIIRKVRAMETPKLRDLASSIGVLYDRQALCAGDPTMRIEGQTRQQMDLSRLSDEELEAYERLLLKAAGN